MFWGITLQANRSHREIVKMPFHISMASLAWNSEREVAKDKKLTSVMLRYEEKEYVLCTLEHGKVMCASLDLVFDKGEQVEFYIMGSGSIHLSGFVVSDFVEESSSEYTTDESEEYDSLSSEESYPSSSESETESSETTTSSNDNMPPRRKKKDVTKDSKQSVKRNSLKEKPKEKNKTVKDNAAVKKKVQELSGLGISLESNSCDKTNKQTKKDVRKLKVIEKERSKSLLDSNINKVGKNIRNDFNKENEISFQKKTSKIAEEERLTASKSDDDAAEEPELSAVAIDSNAKSPITIQKEKKTVKRSSSLETKQMSTPVKKKKKKNSAGNLNSSVKVPKESMEKDLKSNIVEMVDIKVGNGPTARKGKLVHVCYVGYLTNGEEFSSIGNRPFSFRLGNDADIVKGLNSGIEGMKVGGKRKIIVPPSEGFGNKTVRSVPPNSTLTYEVELKAVS